MYILPMLNLVF